MAFAIGPILLLGLLISWLVATITLIVLGFRGKAQWASPYCIACKYDLRGRVPEDTVTCPECGAGLDHPKAIGYVRQGKRPMLIVFGVIIFFLPLLLAIGIWFFLAVSNTPPGPAGLASQSNSTVLTNAQSNINQPWAWNELAKRITNGTLAAAESEQALNDLTAYIKVQYPTGMDSPMTWQADFLEAGYQAGHFSDKALTDFALAYYGAKPIILGIPRLLHDQTRLSFNVEFGNHWELTNHGGMPIELFWVIERSEIDGNPVKVGSTNSTSNNRDVTVDVSTLEPGEHELKVQLSAAIIDVSSNNPLVPHPDTKNRWPNAMYSWTATADAKMIKLSESDRPVSLSTDPSLAPGPDDITVNYILAQPEGNRLHLSLEFKVKDEYVGALSCDVSLMVNEQELKLNHMMYIATGSGRSYGNMRQNLYIDSLDPQIKTADVILTPNPRYVYNRTNVEAIWGKPITIKDVPIYRYDLQEQASDEPDLLTQD